MRRMCGRMFMKEIWSIAVISRMQGLIIILLFWKNKISYRGYSSLRMDKIVCTNQCLSIRLTPIIICSHDQFYPVILLIFIFVFILILIFIFILILFIHKLLLLYCLFYTTILD